MGFLTGGLLCHAVGAAGVGALGFGLAVGAQGFQGFTCGDSSVYGS